MRFRGKDPIEEQLVSGRSEPSDDFVKQMGATIEGGSGRRIGHGVWLRPLIAIAASAALVAVVVAFGGVSGAKNSLTQNHLNPFIAADTSYPSITCAISTATNGKERVTGTTTLTTGTLTATFTDSTTSTTQETVGPTAASTPFELDGSFKGFVKNHVYTAKVTQIISGVSTTQACTGSITG